MTDRRRSRRRVLGAIALGGAASLTGCSGLLPWSTDQSPPDETPTATETPTADVPMFRYDAANTAHRPDGRGPTGDGTERWRVETAGPVRSSPAVVDGTVYASSRDGTVYAIDAAGGQVVWTADIGSTWSSPAVVDGTVYVGSTGGTVHALTAGDGSERWQTDVVAPVTSSPTVASETVFVGVDDGTLRALDTGDGAERWREELGGVTDSASGESAPSGTRLAYEPDGQRAQTAPQTVNTAVSTPAVGGEGVYAATESALYALDRATGARQWSVQFGENAASGSGVDQRLAAHDSGGRFDRLQVSVRLPSSPALFDGSVYVRGYPETVAVGADRGQRLWRTGSSGAAAGTREPSANRLQTASEIDSSPAVTDERVFVGGNRFFAFDRQSGAVSWGRSLSGDVRSSPSVVDGTVYVGTLNGRVVGLNAASGNDEWDADTDGAVVSTPAVTDGSVYVGDTDGTVYAFE